MLQIFHHFRNGFMDKSNPSFHIFLAIIYHINFNYNNDIVIHMYDTYIHTFHIIIVNHFDYP